MILSQVLVVRSMTRPEHDLSHREQGASSPHNNKCETDDLRDGGAIENPRIDRNALRDPLHHRVLGAYTQLGKVKLLRVSNSVMARAATRSSARQTSTKRKASSSPPLVPINRESSPLASVKLEAHTPSKAAKLEIANGTSISPLAARKKKQHDKSTLSEPFPTFSRPTPDECRLAHSILSSIHGARVRPTEVVAPTNRAGCGDSPSVLDALVRTILSQNTSDVNSTRAMMSMNKAYGGCNRWDVIAGGGQAKLQEAIKCGGLSQVKSKVILNILEQVKEKYGDYTLDHLHKASTEDAMSELISFDGVGPKTASCVLLFCLGKADFAVDTHVWRITKLLGWTPKTASREQTYHHLNRRIPDDDKYGLHILLVTHGKRCSECKAGGKSKGECALRRAFKEQVVKGEVSEYVKDEVKDEIKEEMTEPNSEAVISGDVKQEL